MTNHTPSTEQSGVIANAFEPRPLRLDTGAFYEKVASLLPGIVYVFNHDTMANEYSNRSIATLLGYSPQDIIEMGDALLQNVIHPDDLDGLIAYFGSLQELGDDDLAHFEYRTCARDGSVLWLRTIDAVFERDAQGRVLRHIGVASDATEQIEQSLELLRLNESLEQDVADRTRQLADFNASLEKKVKKRTAELIAINEELEQLTYIATHDLKVPITNLTHLTKILTEDAETLSQEQCEVVEWMQASCAQAAAKIGGMVDVAHARSAKVKPLEHVNLSRVADTSCALLQSDIQATKAVITFDFGPANWVDYFAFETSSIFDNLIGNALKYAHPDRTPEIHVSTQVVEGRASLRVRDNGTGLKLPADEDKVFGLFKRAHVHPPGSGIALYTIRKSLNRYGGDISLRSVLGEWTEFEITFPKVIPTQIKGTA